MWCHYEFNFYKQKENTEMFFPKLNEVKVEMARSAALYLFAGLRTKRVISPALNAINQLQNDWLVARFSFE